MRWRNSMQLRFPLVLLVVRNTLGRAMQRAFTLLFVSNDITVGIEHEFRVTQ